jgi:hypothetical protein
LKSENFFRNSRNSFSEKLGRCTVVAR